MKGVPVYSRIVLFHHDFSDFLGDVDHQNWKPCTRDQEVEGIEITNLGRNAITASKDRMDLFFAEIEI